MPQNNGQGRGLPENDTFVARISRNQITRNMKLANRRPRRHGVLIGKRKRVLDGNLCRLLP